MLRGIRHRAGAEVVRRDDCLSRVVYGESDNEDDLSRISSLSYRIVYPAHFSANIKTPQATILFAKLKLLQKLKNTTNFKLPQV